MRLSSLCPANHRHDDRVDVFRQSGNLNLAAGGVILERALRRRAKRVKSLSCIKNIYGLGLLFFRRNRPPAVTGRAERNGEMAPLENFSGANRFLQQTHYATELSSLWLHSQCICGTETTGSGGRFRSAAGEDRSGEQ